MKAEPDLGGGRHVHHLVELLHGHQPVPVRVGGLTKILDKLSPILAIAAQSQLSGEVNWKL